MHHHSSTRRTDEGKTDRVLATPEHHSRRAAVCMADHRQVKKSYHKPTRRGGQESVLARDNSEPRAVDSLRSERAETTFQRTWPRAEEPVRKTPAQVERKMTMWTPTNALLDESWITRVHDRLPWLRWTQLSTPGGLSKQANLTRSPSIQQISRHAGRRRHGHSERRQLS